MVYFLSDAHLGSRAIDNPSAHQQKLIDMLNSMAKDAEAIYLLGDIFDFGLGMHNSWCMTRENSTMYTMVISTVGT
jgi:UDP-2,3-diacylglucosamine pyrophosphatase LpxH